MDPEVRVSQPQVSQPRAPQPGVSKRQMTWLAALPYAWLLCAYGLLLYGPTAALTEGHSRMVLVAFLLGLFCGWPRRSGAGWAQSGIAQRVALCLPALAGAFVLDHASGLPLGKSGGDLLGAGILVAASGLWGAPVRAGWERARSAAFAFFWILPLGWLLGLHVTGAAMASGGVGEWLSWTPLAGLLAQTGLQRGELQAGFELVEPWTRVLGPVGLGAFLWLVVARKPK